MLNPQVGEHYIARVGANLTVIRMDGETKNTLTGRTQYAFTNMVSGREIKIKSKAKLRRHVPKDLVAEMVKIYS